MKSLEKPKYSDWWVFRAQPVSKPLKTTLERCCETWGLVSNVVQMENMMIREFRRVYKGDDRQTVKDDTLYCLSLLRHYGAPVRLLDFTYSKYVAVYFGLEYAYHTARQENSSNPSFDVWCINTKQLILRAKSNYKTCRGFLGNLRKRADIETRDDNSFKQLYMKKYNLVISESPAIIHERQRLQHGVFLCPGNLKISFIDNLQYVSAKTQKPEGIMKLTCRLNLSELREAFEKFRGMNITRESLFPGLDGFAQSMEYQACFYTAMFDRIKKAKQWLK